MADLLQKRKTITKNLFENTKERLILANNRSKQLLLDKSN